MDQLVRLDRECRPKFVSVEGIAIEWLSALAAAGYDRFQLVNQSKIRRGIWPAVKYQSKNETIEWHFKGHSSGPFGTDLPADKWKPLHDVASLWLRFADLKKADPDMTLDNWFDFHATTIEALAKPE